MVARFFFAVALGCAGLFCNGVFVCSLSYICVVPLSYVVYGCVVVCVACGWLWLFVVACG